MTHLHPVNRNNARHTGADSPAWTSRSRVFRAVEKFRAWRTRYVLEATLSNLEDYQLDDLGIARSEIGAYAKASNIAPRLLDAMLAKLDVSLNDTRPRTKDELLRSCRVCPNITACGRWVLTADPPDGYRAFCPNAALFDELLRPGRRALAPQPQRASARPSSTIEP